MSLLPVRVLGDPILRRIADPVRGIDDDLRRLVDNMFETMYAAKGIGLAAPQVGVNARLFVTDVAGARYALINPELVTAEGPLELGEEGCLSIPEIFGDIRRPAQVRMSGTTLGGDLITVDATELLGRCMLHELDHLNGRLFIDHLSFLKRRRALSDWAARESDFPGHVRLLTPGDPGDPDREPATGKL
ncbi:MAG TPA: peptide deformylase [Gemmatimonadaceae bacterium]|nr:peptide deformylase [Gemmatimonadaceae bacterium]